MSERTTTISSRADGETRLAIASGVGERVAQTTERGQLPRPPPRDRGPRQREEERLHHLGELGEQLRVDAPAVEDHRAEEIEATPRPPAGR